MKIRKYSAADDALIGREVRTYSWTLKGEKECTQRSKKR
jgi:hypothetical protein